MKEKLDFPPHLPEHLQSKKDLWVGTRDSYSPQLIVSNGPDLGELKKAYRGKNKVTLCLESRICDMDDDEPNIVEGNVEVEIVELFEDSSTYSFNFLATGKLPYGGNLMWVWGYCDHKGGADFSVGLNDSISS